MSLTQLFNKYSQNKKKKRKIVIQEYYGEAKSLKKSLSENIKLLKQLLGEPADLIIREFELGEKAEGKLALIFIDGLTNGTYIHDFILKGLMIEISHSDVYKNINNNSNLLNILKKYSIPISDIKEVSDYKLLCEKLLSGDSILLYDGSEMGLILETKGWQDRGVTEPSSETVIRGARDSFNETLRTNTALVRRRIIDVNLRVISRNIGTVTKTAVEIMYIEGIANEKIVQDVVERIEKINIDGVLESGYLEELLIDEHYSLFPTMYSTERPDTVAGNLLEGRIAILTDGTPFVLLVPVVFVQFFQSVEDYYQRSIFASFLRIIRYISFFLALLTPSIYIAVTTFHLEMIPTPLIINISAQRENVPFPAIIEVIIMELTFEVLREAGVRMPRAIGSAISIVGALVIGEAAVNAGIVSNFMVIIVSVTAISSLITPEYNFSNPIRLLRFAFIILGATFGLFGISVGLMFLAVHLCGLRSFGVPYMYPFAPFNWQGLKDAFIRAPLNSQFKRPKIITEEDIIRQNDEQNSIKNDVEQKN